MKAQPSLLHIQDNWKEIFVLVEGENVKLPIFNLLEGFEARNAITPNGIFRVYLGAKCFPNVRAVYTGEAEMEFMWVSTGKSVSWQFRPNISKSKSMSLHEAEDQDGLQVKYVEFDQQIFPA